jgi:putative phosphoesterase
LIGDVHANLPALEAVLEDAHRQEVEAIWNVGDFVGYGAFPNQVIERLRDEEAVSIAGNYDLKVLRFKKKRKKWRKRKQSQKFLAFQWARHTLTKRSREYLGSLPTERELQVDGLRILLTHGSPASEKEHLAPDTPEERLRELASMVEANVVICGHSHLPFARRVDGVHFINTGSVGRPDDGDPRACYAVLQVGDGSDGDVQLRHHRVAYDVVGAVAAIRGHGLPESFAQMMIQGRALDDVMERPQTWDVAGVASLTEGRPTAAGMETRPALVSRGGAEVERRLKAVLELAESYDYEEEHTHHVMELSLRLFDELQPLHQLGLEERFLLRCGALLHDIGWIKGQKGHHKTSRDLILGASELSFDDRERLIVASIARYHRRALPKDKHDQFAALSPVDQYRVTVLAALLRVADGLDRTHRNVVQDLSCEILPRQIAVCCAVCMYPIPEREEALHKGDLLERAFERELLIEWELT